MGLYRQTPESRAARLRWHFKNHERSLAISRQWKESNPDKVRAWNEANADRKAASVETRRARILNADKGFTADDWRRKLAEADYTCAYCGRRGGQLEMDHVIPLSKGGEHSWGNIVPACMPCNRHKGTQAVA